MIFSALLAVASVAELPNYGDSAFNCPELTVTPHPLLIPRS
jgi:hypothetical protein